MYLVGEDPSKDTNNIYWKLMRKVNAFVYKNRQAKKAHKDKKKQPVIFFLHAFSQCVTKMRLKMSFFRFYIKTRQERCSLFAVFSPYLTFENFSNSKAYKQQEVSVWSGLWWEQWPPLLLYRMNEWMSDLVTYSS